MGRWRAAARREWPQGGAGGGEFDVDAGFGMISAEAADEEVFFSFTAIPGEGYRTLRPGTPVSFELVENETGPTARNIRREKTNDDGRS